MAYFIDQKNIMDISKVPAGSLPGNDIMSFAAIGINQQMLPVFLGLLVAAAVAWLFLSSRLYAALRQNHPGLYETLGSPKLFMKKSFSTNLKVSRFLFRQDYERSGDQAVIRLCQGLRYLFCIYIICLSGCLILLFGKFD